MNIVVVIGNLISYLFLFFDTIIYSLKDIPIMGDNQGARITLEGDTKFLGKTGAYLGSIGFIIAVVIIVIIVLLLLPTFQNKKEGVTAGGNQVLAQPNFDNAEAFQARSYAPVSKMIESMNNNGMNGNGVPYVTFGGPVPDSPDAPASALGVQRDFSTIFGGDMTVTDLLATEARDALLTKLGCPPSTLAAYRAQTTDEPWGWLRYQVTGQSPQVTGAQMIAAPVNIGAASEGFKGKRREKMITDASLSKQLIF